jgi:hypothetical protein
MPRSFLKVSLVRIAVFGLIVSLCIFGFPGKAYADWQCRLLSPSDPTNFNNFLGEGFGITKDAAGTAAMNDCLRLNDRTGCSFGFPSCREMPDNITPPPPPDPNTKAGNYRLSDGTIFYSNGSDAYCTYQSPDHIILADMTDEEIHPAASFPSSFRNDKSCPVYLPPGAYRLVDGRIIASNGSAYCRYVSYGHYAKKDGRPIRQLDGAIPLNAMQNHSDCGS